MITLMLAAICGGIISAVVALPFSVALGLLAAPFGGSLCAVLAGLYIAHRNSDGQSDLDAQTDEMVAVLRELTAKAEQADPMNAVGAEGGKLHSVSTKAA